ncbi:hypothetical protein PAXRUDRAFT_272912 [Paxillus rubicundulus Ve08.2h10]|uniref:Uncharacterized protein n=1 Tax=Paxillus rubicundulus Ve08.2h10 TaxID=930991 RepID=A0A0D0C9R1_9AGAM|nr:hypothetical protein PAXRUDRAFT_272912 [Paxillus rubicundulus Ve08.2h10]
MCPITFTLDPRVDPRICQKSPLTRTHPTRSMYYPYSAVRVHLGGYPGNPHPCYTLTMLAYKTHWRKHLVLRNPHFHPSIICSL